MPKWGDGGGVRVVPIFPELYPLLQTAFETAEPGEVNVITRYRDTNQNLRTQLRRIIKRAGLVPWPKLFQNLRSTRETELCERFPMHVVTAWLGNSPEIARKHYLQTTEQHYAKAVEGAPEKAVQNPVQQAAETGRNEPQEQGDESEELAICGANQTGAGRCENTGPLATDPTGIRTPVAGLKSPCPRPLDDGAAFRGSQPELSRLLGHGIPANHASE